MLHLVTNKGKDVERLSEMELMRAINSQHSRTDYSRSISRWEDVFGADNLFIGFFEDLQHRPEELLKDICEFIDVPYDTMYFTETCRKNIFNGPQHKMPQNI